MRVDLFDFDLPKDRIAERPLEPRDSARLLCVDPKGPLTDRIIRDLPDLLDPGDLVVLNDTRVIPARLFGRIGIGKVELMLHRRVSDDTWNAFARPARKLHPGVIVTLTDEPADGDPAGAFTAECIEKGDGGEVTVRFNRSGPTLFAALEAHGHIPLPPYIKRPDDARDRSDYQTVYARADGAVAAPTAGLHLTDALFSALEARGIQRTTLTLHVGAGTFLPVKSNDTDDHVMHREDGIITAETAQLVNDTHARGGRVIAVGTTVLRLLESAANEDGTLRPFEGGTSLFITPGYRFRVVDRLLTNFHLPRSTLFMLVSAFAGLETMRAAYDHAIASGYRFYSYGDGSLLTRQD